MDVATLTRNFDGRADFREGLQELYECERCERNFLNAQRIKRVLRRPRIFEKVYKRATEESAEALMLTGAAGTFAVNGDFAKWFLEWLQNGGWETILTIIKELIQLFG